MAAETNNTHHIVEIPVDQEHHQNNNNNNKALLCSNMFDAIDDHPLTEISESPGHLLLLKLWQREENLFAKRISRKETRMDSIKSELFQLTSFFFIFHGFFLTLLFTSWQKTQMNGGGGSCKIWWIPSLISLSTSLVFVFLVQVKLVRYWKVWEQLQRERNDSRGVGRCIQELRMKGASFDLSKELQVNGKKMKSSSVEIKWTVVTWFNRYLLTVCLVCFTGLAFPASKFVLCGL